MVEKINPVSKVIPLDNRKRKRPTKDEFKQLLNRPPDGPNGCA